MTNTSILDSLISFSNSTTFMPYSVHKSTSLNKHCNTSSSQSEEYQNIEEIQMKKQRKVSKSVMKVEVKQGKKNEYNKKFMNISKALFKLSYILKKKISAIHYFGWIKIERLKKLNLRIQKQQQLVSVMNNKGFIVQQNKLSRFLESIQIIGIKKFSFTNKKIAFDWIKKNGQRKKLLVDFMVYCLKLIANKQVTLKVAGLMSIKNNLLLYQKMDILISQINFIYKKYNRQYFKLFFTKILTNHQNKIQSTSKQRENHSSNQAKKQQILNKSTKSNICPSKPLLFQNFNHNHTYLFTPFFINPSYNLIQFKQIYPNNINKYYPDQFRIQVEDVGDKQVIFVQKSQTSFSKLESQSSISLRSSLNSHFGKQFKQTNLPIQYDSINGQKYDKKKKNPFFDMSYEAQNKDKFPSKLFNKKILYNKNQSLKKQKQYSTPIKSGYVSLRNSLNKYEEDQSNIQVDSNLKGYYKNQNLIKDSKLIIRNQKQKYLLKTQANGETKKNIQRNSNYQISSKRNPQQKWDINNGSQMLYETRKYIRKQQIKPSRIQGINKPTIKNVFVNAFRKYD